MKNIEQIAVLGPSYSHGHDLGERLAAKLGAEYCAEAAAIEGAQVVVVLPPPPAPRSIAVDVEAGEDLVRAALEAGARRLVVTSSAAIHEANNHHTGLITEERLGARRTGNPIAASWEAFEKRVAELSEDKAVEIVVLRPAPIPTRGGRDFWSRLLRSSIVFTALGYDPSLQFLSFEDFAAAAALAARGSATGTYHVAPRGVVPLFRGLRLAGAWPVPVPGPLQRLVRALLVPLGLAASAAHVDYLSYFFTVSGAAIERDFGFRPAHSSAQVARGFRRGAPPLPERPETVSAAGDEEFDAFGMSPGYIRFLSRGFFRFLHDAYWRVEVDGFEHVPAEGGAVMVGVHRGHQPWDGVMMLHLLERRLGRLPRFLIHPTLVRFPFLAPYMIRCGGLHASQENADWVLERGELLGVFPEGIRGAFAMYKDAYELRKFGRGEYVRMALRHRVPIVPFVTVGSAEIFPILGRIDWRWWQRVSEWPFFPITPTLSLVPLPSKWHTRFLPPYDLSEYPPEAAEDRRVVREIGREIKAHIQSTIDEMVERRPAIFWGSIFEREERAA